MPIPPLPPSEASPAGTKVEAGIPMPLPDPRASAAVTARAARDAAARAIRHGLDIEGADRELADDELRFVTEYVASCDTRRAAAAAGWSARKAAEARRDRGLQLAIQRARAAVRAVHQASLDEVVGELHRVAMADARELVSYVYRPCAKCWPDEVAAQTDVPPTPDPSCDFCRGEGVGSTEVRDTRDLSESGRALFAGIKQTQHGTYVLMHSKMDAIEKLLKIAGAYDLDNRQKAAPIAEVLEYLAMNRQGLPIRK